MTTRIVRHPDNDRCRPYGRFHLTTTATGGTYPRTVRVGDPTPGVEEGNVHLPDEGVGSDGTGL